VSWVETSRKALSLVTQLGRGKEGFTAFTESLEIKATIMKSNGNSAGASVSTVAVALMKEH
jgi:hypothetical protein